MVRIRRRRTSSFRRIIIAVIAVVLLGPLSVSQMSRLDQKDPMGLTRLLVPEYGQEQVEAATEETARQTPVITGLRRTHILYGDRSGGGHLHGAGIPCKSEFPANWSAEKIIGTVERAAANDNIPWALQENGYYAADVMADNIRMRIVLNGDKSEVITAYPLNVQRNPCPANDNRRY
jgi:hypothetical protein